MPKIYVNNMQFSSKGSSSTREHEYEAAILSDAHRIFPDLFIRRFKFDLTNGLEVKRPDLIYITKDYSRWGFIEVELSHHSVGNHIIPQIDVISNATPPMRKIIDFYGRLGLDVDNLTSLLKFEPPQNYIIVDRQVEGLSNEARKFGFKVCILEIFESISGEIAVRQNGQDLPSKTTSEALSVQQSRRVNIFKGVGIPTMNRVVYLGNIFDCEVINSNGISWLIIKDITNVINGEIKLIRSSIGMWILVSEGNYV